MRMTEFLFYCEERIVTLELTTSGYMLLSYTMEDGGYTVALVETLGL